jgi:hypothetical protein
MREDTRQTKFVSEVFILFGVFTVSFDSVIIVSSYEVLWLQ